MALRLRLLSCLVFSTLLSLCQAAEIRDFKVVVKRIEDGQIRYYQERLSGVERTNSGLNRSGLGSENQLDYPQPDSGCGPTALLNILIWYETYGLVQAQSRDADPRIYKQKLFKNIDRHIMAVAEVDRTSQQGTNSAQVGIALDELVQAGSKNELRVHTDFIKAPLTLSDFLNVTKQFRAGYLVVDPIGNDRYTIPTGVAHAATILRCDRAGNITLGTWGQIYRGRLQMRGSEQWFIPSNPEHLKLKVDKMIEFIPFKPLATGAGH